MLARYVIRELHEVYSSFFFLGGVGGGQQQNQAPEPNKGVDPATQAKAEAERKATMSQQRSAIQAQIKSLDDQKKALMAQLASMK